MTPRTFYISSELIFRHFKRIDAVACQFDKKQELGKIRQLSRCPADDRPISNSLTAISVLASLLNSAWVMPNADSISSPQSMVRDLVIHPLSVC